MNITFTLDLDGDVADFTSLLGWLADHYHGIEISISVPEFTAHAVASETGPHHPDLGHISVVQTILDHEEAKRKHYIYDDDLDDIVEADWADYGDIDEIANEEAELVRQSNVAASAVGSYTQYCRCSHDRESHNAYQHDMPCTADACDCPSFTATSPFPPITLDEM